MIANEIRIGNLVQDEEGVFPITKTFFTLLDINLKDTNPIPLTEEWLLKFGYENNDEFYKNIFRKEGSAFSVFINNGKISLGIGIITIEVEYLHKFQNLLFELENKELTLKQ